MDMSSHIHEITHKSRICYQGVSETYLWHQDTVPDTWTKCAAVQIKLYDPVQKVTEVTQRVIMINV